MEWMEVKVLTTTEAADLISEILLELGSEGAVIEDRNDVFANQRPEGQWDIIDPAIAERIGEDVRSPATFPPTNACRIRSPRCASGCAVWAKPRGNCRWASSKSSWSSVADEDWSQSWKRAFKPVRLGERFVVRPAGSTSRSRTATAKS